MLKVDALRVVQDPEYAASLSDAHWRALSADPAWNELVGEYHEMVSPVLALYSAQLGMQEPMAAPAASRGPAQPEPVLTKVGGPAQANLALGRASPCKPRQEKADMSIGGSGLLFAMEQRPRRQAHLW